MTQAILSICSLIIGLLLGLTLAHQRQEAPTSAQESLQPSSSIQLSEQTAFIEALRNRTPSEESTQILNNQSLETTNHLLFTKIEEQTNTIHELTTQYRELHSQLTETNREINALTFRVETHSESFRPMRQRQENSVFPSGISPLLPPKQ